MEALGAELAVELVGGGAIPLAASWRSLWVLGAAGSVLTPGLDRQSVVGRQVHEAHPPAAELPGSFHVWNDKSDVRK